MIAENPGKFFDSQYLPENVHLREPTRMQGGDIWKLCDHLLQRQTLGKPVFRFLHVLPHHRRGGHLEHAVSNHQEQSHGISDEEHPSPNNPVQGPAPEKGKGKQSTLSLSVNSFYLEVECF